MPLVKPTSPVLQRDHPLTVGLVAAWPFFEGAGGSLNDLSGKRNTGTLTGSPSWEGGEFGSALSLNGSTQYVDLGNGINTAEITYCAWVKPRTLTNAYQGIVGRSNGTNFSILLLKSSGKLAPYVGTVSYDGTGANTLTVGKWYHLVVTYSVAAGLVGYVNGSVDGTTASAGALNTTAASFRIGNDPGVASREFDGLVDGVLVYDRALSASEIAELYFDPFAIYRPRSRWWESISPTYTFPGKSVIVKPVSPVLQRDHPLAQGIVGAWAFHEGAGSTVNDLSGNRNTGTATASLPWIGSSFGEALSFDASHYLDCGLGPYLAQFSIVAVVTPTSFADFRGILVRGTQANRNYDLNIEQTTGKLQLYFTTSGTFHGVNANTALSLNGTHVVAGTFDGATLIAYLNGKPDGTLSAASVPDNVNGLKIGAIETTNVFSGGISMVALYNRALSPSEIAQLSFDPFVIFRPPSHYLDFILPNTPSSFDMSSCGVCVSA